MKQLIRAMTLLASVALAGTAVADDAPPSPVSPAGAQTDHSNDWSQTRLDPDPALREQIERTKSYLEENKTEVDEAIVRLKTAGQLDRRSTSTIRNALDNARDAMNGMAEGMNPTAKQYDGWTARMIAYELGMAADALVQQANQIETELNEPHTGNAQTGNGHSLELDKQRDLVQTLKTTSTLLRSTAQAITRKLK